MSRRQIIKWALLSFVLVAFLAALIVPAFQPARENDERAFAKFREEYRKEQETLKSHKPEGETHFPSGN